MTARVLGSGPCGWPECAEMHRKTLDSGSEEEAGINSYVASGALG